MKLTDSPANTPLRLVHAPLARMEDLGFVPGTRLSLIGKRAGFPLIVQTPDGIYLIDRKTAAGTEVEL